jgi:serine protease AprX
MPLLPSRGSFAATVIAGGLAGLLSLAAVPAASAAAPDAEYIVQFDHPLDAAGRAALVERAGGRVTRDVRLINAVGAELTPAEASGLGRDGAVKAVTRNAAVTPKTRVNFDPGKMATAYNQSARTSDLWSDVTGKGVGVAVIDTGIAGDMTDFRVSQTDPSSRVIAGAVVNPFAKSATDTYGHGTLVAGIVAGNGGNRGSTDPLRGKYAGAAPDANLVSVKISDDAGNATVLDAIYGVQFAVDHRAAYNIRVINLSVESEQAQSYRVDPLDAAVEAAWFDGIVVVAAAGNRGDTPGAVGYAPGNDPYVITVGAVDDQGTKDVKDDVVASWSSRGITQDGFAKPELYAPGAHIVANLAPGSAFASQCPDCVVSGNYIQAGGTSLSAPIIAGAAAAILEKRSTWTPDMVKGALLKTKRLIENGREVDAQSAYKADAQKLPANAGLEPNRLVNPSTGTIDYTRATWRVADWDSASEVLTAAWSRATWRCTCSVTASGAIDPTRATWRRATWRSLDWTK